MQIAARLAVDLSRLRWKGERRQIEVNISEGWDSSQRETVKLAHLSEVVDGPHDGKEDGAAADDVHEVQDVSPGQPALRPGRSLLQDNHGHIIDDLQR